MEEIVVKILGLLLLIMTVGLLLFAIGSSFYFKFQLYFLNLKLQDHPLLIEKINKVLNDICTAENLKVFHVSYEELNKDEINPKSNAIGRYVYSSNLEMALKTIDEVKESMRRTELKYGKPYNELCIEAGLEPIDEERLHIPRIMMCGDMKHFFGLESYYGTYFHELGHHFVVKTIGAEINHTEEDADMWAAKLIKEHLPSYFMLFFSFPYRFKEYGLKLTTTKEKIKAFVEFLGYLKEKRKFDKNKNNE